MEPDADQAWMEFEQSLSDMTRNSRMIGVIQAAYRAGYRAALPIPSAEVVIERAEAALAALRTTKEENDV